ncbi:hypothetical protein HNQ56_003120 [Anaerotaenia torta]|uniref:DUF6179 domain-containing protein n=1 Tax=Anaerotaenia torta TaxID=433293 RepID=UPI003D243BAD
MDYLNRAGLGIEEGSLDPRYYFQSLLQAAAEQKQLTQQQVQELQYGLIHLMTKEVERYTNAESSSIPVEKAQELLQSITYQIGSYLKTIPDMQNKLDLLKQEAPEVLFYRGMKLVTEAREEALQLLTKLQKKNRRWDSIAYEDTVYHGLPEFFHDYDIEYGAHEIPGSIDYPLMCTMRDYLGVEYVHEYLKRLTIEDNILSRFSGEAVRHLIDSYDPEARHLLVNLCELATINAIGCVLLGRELREPLLSRREIGELTELLKGGGIVPDEGGGRGLPDRGEMQRFLRDTVMQMGEFLLLSREETDYIQGFVPELAMRLWSHLDTNSLEKLFLYMDREEEAEEKLYTGEPMEDERLRELIEEIRETEELESKVRLIQERVSSIADLTEILEECFYPGEYTRVYRLLGSGEVALLRKSILAEGCLSANGNIHEEEYEPRSEWEKELFQLQEEESLDS